MDQSEMPACEGCGTTGRSRTRNRLPEGTRLVLCHRCSRQTRDWWRAWHRIQPEQAERLVQEARQDERRRERQAAEGGL